MSDAYAKKATLRIQFVCPETDRTVDFECDLKDIRYTRNGQYDPDRDVQVPNCSACGQHHVVDL